jgi:hypothetical protein
MKKYYEKDVDKWVEENGEFDAYSLLSSKIPGIIKKLDKLDKKLISILEEIREVFPDAQYYTASGGFNVVLGATHDDEVSQEQRSAWGGHATIGDGDW